MLIANITMKKTSSIDIECYSADIRVPISFDAYEHNSSCHCYSKLHVLYDFPVIFRFRQFRTIQPLRVSWRKYFRTIHGIALNKPSSFWFDIFYRIAEASSETSYLCLPAKLAIVLFTIIIKFIFSWHPRLVSYSWILNVARKLCWS